MTTAIGQLERARQDDEPTTPDPSARRRRLLGIGLAVVVYAALSLVPNALAWIHGPSHYALCGGCGDNGQEIWFLASGAHSLAHLQNPLRTTWLNAPYGVDLADTTSMPLAGIITAPLTWLFGPIFTYNFVYSFSFFSAAVCAMLAARRWVRWPPAAFLAGLLYGFSPYMVGEGRGHLFLMLSFVFPLILIVLDEIFVRQRRSPWLGGLALAVLVVLQLGISPEMLVDAAALVVAGLVILLLTCRHQVRQRLPHALKAAVLALGLALPFVAFYWVTAATGPEHSSGFIHNMAQLSGLASNLLGPFLPTTSQVVNFGHANWSSNMVAMTPPGRPAQPDITENGIYIGIPILLLVLGGIFLGRRSYVVRFFGVLAVIAFVFSLGANLHVGNTVIQTHMPFRFFLHFPFLRNDIASRWSLFVWLFVAILAAMALDYCRAAASSGATAPEPNGARRGRLLLPAGLLLAVLGIVSLLPDWPMPQFQAAWIPGWFTSPAEKTVPPGSVLLTYPNPTDGFATPMVWQAVDAFRFRIPGGEAGAATVHNAPIENALQACFVNPKLKAAPVSSWPAARAELARYRIRTIVAPPVPPWYNQACGVAFLSHLVGAPPKSVDGSYVWTNIKA